MKNNLGPQRKSDFFKHRLIVVGASSGGLIALSEFLGGLPAGLQAAVLIVQHVGSQVSRLAELLQRHTSLPTRFAADRDILQPGHILVAPPDFHLLAYQSHVRLVRSAKENYARPAIDPLFRTAAAAHGKNLIGIILSGDLDDGTVGLQAVQAYGGIVMIQDPDTAAAPSMPASAKRYTEPDYCLSAAELGAAAGAASLPENYTPGAVTVNEVCDAENRFSEMRGTMDDLDRIGAVSNFTCPECHGALWQIKGEQPLRFRCHTGHSYTARHLAASQEIAVEEALWGAIRALQEKQKLFEKFRATALNNDQSEAASEYAAQAKNAGEQAVELRRLVADEGRRPEDQVS